MHKNTIDTFEYKNLDFVFTIHNNNQDGFETVISLDSLKNGKHDLNVYIAYKSKDSLNTIGCKPFRFGILKSKSSIKFFPNSLKSKLP